MDSSEAIFNGLKDAGIDFIVSVPCVNLSKLLNMTVKYSESQWAECLASLKYLKTNIYSVGRNI